MNKIVSLEDYKNNKSIPEDGYSQVYEFFYTLIDLNYDMIIETLEMANNKDELKEILYGFANQLVAQLSLTFTKEEILQFIENGAMFSFQVIAGETLSDYPEIKRMFNRLRD